MELPQPLLDKINQAVMDLNAADNADQDDATATQALVAAQATEEAAKAKSLDAHKIALTSAHDAIDAMSEFLHIPPPVPPTPAA